MATQLTANVLPWKCGDYQTTPISVTMVMAALIAQQRDTDNPLGRDVGHVCKLQAPVYKATISLLIV